MTGLCPRRFPAAPVLLAAALSLPAHADVPAPERVRLPPGTEVALAFDESIDVELRRAGDPVQLRLAADVLVEGRVAVPAGTAATGEIVHLAVREGGGRAAELVVTARLLHAPQGLVPLHAAFAVSGTNGGRRAMWGGAVPGIGSGLMVAGLHDVTVDKGQALLARVTSDLPLPPDPPTSTAMPVPDVASALIGTPEPGKGQVVFFRPAQYSGPGAACVISENGAELGRLHRGSLLVFSVMPGRHRYVARHEKGKGKDNDVLTLEVAPGEVYYVQGTIHADAWRDVANISPTTAATFDAERKELEAATVPVPADTP